MVSFDVVSLFPKIPVGLAMEIAKNRFKSYPSEDLQEITNWSVEEICTGLRIRLLATYLKFRHKFFRQIHGTAMGSPVSVVVANLVMEDVEERAIDSFGQPPRVWKAICRRHFCNFGQVVVVVVVFIILAITNSRANKHTLRKK